LVGWLGSNNRETTSRSKLSLSKRYSSFSTTRSTTSTATSRRGVREICNTRSSSDLSSTNSSYKGRSSRIRRIKMGLSTIRISSSIGSRITRSREKRNTTKTNLLEFSIDTSYILLRVNSKLLAFLGSNSVFTLIFFVPTVRNRTNIRNFSSSEKVNSPTIKPYTIILYPEPTVSINTGG